MAEQPQSWDTEKVMLAYSDAIGLVEALDADRTGDAYRQELARIAEWRLEPAEGDEDFFNRLAYVLYGSALFGLGALKGVEAEGKISREEALARISQSVDKWLG